MEGYEALTHMAESPPTARTRRGLVDHQRPTGTVGLRSTGREAGTEDAIHPLASPGYPRADVSELGDGMLQALSQPGLRLRTSSRQMLRRESR